MTRITDRSWILLGAVAAEDMESGMMLVGEHGDHFPVHFTLCQKHLEWFRERKN